MAVVDLQAVRATVAAELPEVLVQVLAGRSVEHAVQRVGAALLRLGSAPSGAAVLAPVMRQVAEVAQRRGDEGDGPLAEDLLALAEGRPLPGKVLRIDVEDLAEAASDHSPEGEGGYLNLDTGEVAHAFEADPGIVDDPIDFDEGDWLPVLFESREGWDDMAEFVATVTDPRVAAQLERALHGRRPFAAFKDAAHRLDRAQAWYDFSEERQFGRLRRLLAREDIHPI